MTLLKPKEEIPFLKINDEINQAALSVATLPELFHVKRNNIRKQPRQEGQPEPFICIQPNYALQTAR